MGKVSRREMPLAVVFGMQYFAQTAERSSIPFVHGHCGYASTLKSGSSHQIGQAAFVTLGAGPIENVSFASTPNRELSASLGQR